MPQTELQEKVWKARDAVLALVKTAKNGAMFPRDHPQYRKSASDFVQSLASYTDRYGALKLQTSPEAFFLEGQEVYAWEQGLPFRLYMDGVRELTFHPPVEPAEIERFLEIVQRDPGAAAGEEDFVALFWRAGFKGITYFAMDELYADYFGFSEEEEGEVDARTKERRDRIRDLVSSFTARDLPAGVPGRMRLEVPDIAEEFAAAAREVSLSGGETAAGGPSGERGETGRSVLEISPEASAAFRTEVAALGAAELVPRSVDVAYAVLLGFEDEGARADARQFLSTLFDAALAQGDFPTVVLFLDRLRELDAAAGESAAGFSAAFLRQLSEEDAVKGALGIIAKKYLGGPEGIYKYFFHLDPGALLTLAGAYGSIPDKNVRRVVRDLFLARARENLEAITTLATSPNPAVVRDGLYILGQIEDEVALDPLAKVLRSKEESVREYALWLVSKIPGDGRRDVLVKTLSDPQRKIRILALRYLAQAGDPAVVPVLLKAMRDRAFSDRSAEEVRAWAECVCALGGAGAAAALGELAGRGRLFERRRTREFRRILRGAARIADGRAAPPPAG